MSDPLQLYGLCPSRLLCPWDFSGKNTGMGCYFLLQRIFPTQGSNLCLLECRADSLPLVPPGKPLIWLWNPLFYHCWTHFGKCCVKGYTWDNSGFDELEKQIQTNCTWTKGLFINIFNKSQASKWPSLCIESPEMKTQIRLQVPWRRI